MNKIIFVALVVFSCITMISHAQDCKVKLDAISGSYEGDCKKGLADGVGVAKGKDTYEGEFKKGFPHGKGIYTWENKDIYEGGFSQGLMEGEGKFTATNDNGIITGFWKDGEYIGKEKDPFKLLNRDSKIQTVKARRLNGEKDQVDVVFQKQGKRISTDAIVIKSVGGNFANVIQNGFKKEIQQVNYPFRAMISGPADFEFNIGQAGHWEIVVDLMPD